MKTTMQTMIWYIARQLRRPCCCRFYRPYPTLAVIPAPALTLHFPSSTFHIPPALCSTLTALRPGHHRIEVVGLNCSTGPVRFTSINDGSLVAIVKTGAYSRKGLGTGALTTYGKDPGVIFCALEVGRLQLLARSCRQLNSNSANGYPGARGHTTASRRDPRRHARAGSTPLLLCRGHQSGSFYRRLVLG